LVASAFGTLVDVVVKAVVTGGLLVTIDCYFMGIVNVDRSLREKCIGLMTSWSVSRDVSRGQGDATSFEGVLIIRASDNTLDVD